MRNLLALAFAALTLHRVTSGTPAEAQIGDAWSCASSRSTISTAIFAPPLGGIRIADPDDKTKKITVPAGGVEHMATLVKELSEGHKNTIFVAAGDLIGASPLLSAMFHDEPTIESLSMMGLALASVGNHEFDEGKERDQADAEWRLPSGRPMPGAASFFRREVSLPGGLHGRDCDRQDDLSTLRNQGIRRHSGRLHRPDPERNLRHYFAGECRRAWNFTMKPRP